MKRALCIIALAASSLSISLAADAQTDNLEGRWRIVAVPDGWKRIPGTNVVVTPDEVQICLGKLVTSKLKYRLDPARGAVDSSRTVRGKRVVQLGTYRREGDTLVLSVGPEGKERPSNPDATQDGAMRWVLKKAG